MRPSRHVAFVVSVSVTVLSLADALGPTARAAQAAPLSREERCVDRRVVLAAKAAAAKLRCHATAARTATTVDPACLARAHTNMDRALDRLAARGCPEEARSAFSVLLGQASDDYVDRVLGILSVLVAYLFAVALVLVAVLVVLMAKARRVATRSQAVTKNLERIAARCGSAACAVAVQEATTEFVDGVADAVGGTTTTTATIATTTTTVAETTTTTTSTTTTTLALVDFVATPLTGPAPLLATFTNLSTGSFTTWHWDFGDGGTSNAPQPVHQYLVPGIYTVSLSADGGPPVVRMQYVQVF